MHGWPQSSFFLSAKVTGSEILFCVQIFPNWSLSVIEYCYLSRELSSDEKTNKQKNSKYKIAYMLVTMVTKGDEMREDSREEEEDGFGYLTS